MDLDDASEPGASAISITVQATEAETQTTTEETTTTIVSSVVTFLSDQIDRFVEQAHIRLDQLLNISQGVIDGSIASEAPEFLSSAGYHTVDEIRVFLQDDLKRMIEHGLLASLRLLICDLRSDATGVFRTYYDIAFRVLPNDPQQLIRLDDSRATPNLIHIANHLVSGSRAVLLLEWNTGITADKLAAIRKELHLEWDQSPHVYNLGSLRIDHEHQETRDGMTILTAKAHAPGI